MTIRLPYQLNGSTVAEALRGLQPNSKLKFQGSHNLTPSGAVVLASQFSANAIEPHQIDCPPQLLNGSYLANIGLLSAIGVTHSPQLGTGGLRHIPISNDSYEHLSEKLVGRVPSPYEVSRKLAQELLNRLIPGKDQAGARSGLQHSVAEIVRNVFDHSNTGRVWYAAQYWPGSGIAEISIGDTGIGLYNSFLERQAYQGIKDGLEALRISLLPGVSRNLKIFGEPISEEDNARYGLYIASEYCRSCGEFTLHSGTSRLSLEGGLANFVDAPGIQGTVLTLRLHVDRLPVWDTKRTEILDRASRIKQFAKNSSKYGLALAREIATFIDP